MSGTVRSHAQGTLFRNSSPLSFLAPVATGMPPSNVGTVLSAGFNPGHNQWSTIIERNNHMIHSTSTPVQLPAQPSIRTPSSSHGHSPVPPSLSASIAQGMSPSDIGELRAAGQGQNHWSTTIERNKQMIEAWQSRMYMLHRTTTNLAQNILPDNQNGTPWGANGVMPVHLARTSDSDETDRKSDSNSGTTNDSSTKRADGEKRSRKGKSKRKAVSSSSSSDGTNGSDVSKSGSGPDALPDNSDAISSSSNRKHKKKRKKHDKDKSKSYGKKSKEPKKKLVNLFPRKKKSEDHRSRDHMIIALENLKPLFQLPLKQAASNLGICTTALKSVCRKFGLKRWPYSRLPGCPPSTSTKSDPEVPSAAYGTYVPTAQGSVAPFAPQNFSGVNTFAL